MARSWSFSSSPPPLSRSEEHTSELQSQSNLVCRLLLEKKHSIDSLLRALYGIPRLVVKLGKLRAVATLTVSNTTSGDTFLTVQPVVRKFYDISLARFSL